MNVTLYNFMESNKSQLASAIQERMRGHVPESQMSNDALEAVVSDAIEGFVDLILTDETDQLDAVHRSILTHAAAQPTRLGGILHLYLVIADVTRASLAQEATTSDVDVNGARVGRALLSIDPHAGRATRALFDAFQDEFNRSTVPSAST